MTTVDELMAQLLNPLGLSFDDALKPGASEEQKAAFDRAKTDQLRICQDAKYVLSIPEGARLFQHLREMTIDNSTWLASMGLINGAANGFAREGQNSIIRHVSSLAKMADSLAATVKAEHKTAKEGKKNAKPRK